MLVNCSAENRPCTKLSGKMHQRGVPGPTREKTMRVAPKHTVLAMRIWRWPKRARRDLLSTFIMMAAAAWGMVSRPACQAGKPMPTW